MRIEELAISNENPGFHARWLLCGLPTADTRAIWMAPISKAEEDHTMSWSCHLRHAGVAIESREGRGQSTCSRHPSTESTSRNCMNCWQEPLAL